MKIILIVLAVVLFVWSLYDYLRIGIMIKQYSKEERKNRIKASVGGQVMFFLGLLLAAACLVTSIVYSKSSLLLSAVVCFSASSRGFCQVWEKQKA